MTSIAAIAARLQGYDPQALRADVALAFVLAMVEPVVQTEDVALRDAQGRVLARDAVSPIDVPAHNNSAMDGYAFDGAQLSGSTAGVPLTLEVVATARAGAAMRMALAPGQCLKIMTGAVLPEGLDTVVPQEMVQVQGNLVHIPAGAVRTGDNNRRAGEDVQRGHAAVLAGTLLGPAALGLLASLGLQRVEVRRRVRVAILSTGDEIQQPGETLREGAVYDSNRTTLGALLARLGVEVLDLGAVSDDPPSLRSAFAHGAAGADAIISSGGVSVGEADHTRHVMRELAGGEHGVAFWRIAMRPGRPMAVGRIGNAVLFGLPGNPVAVMVTYLAFVRPALLRRMGCVAPHTPPPLQARSQEAIRKRAGRTEYQRAVVSLTAHGELVVRTTGQQGSGVLSSMVQANGLMVLPHDSGDVQPGDLVSVLMFDGLI